MLSCVTKEIRVAVEPCYQRSQSSPENGYFFWTYTITLTNLGDETVQLISRHWIITDATHQVTEVKGEGVVGKQPILEPGDSFTYTSGCPLNTSSGSMRGTYTMESEAGDTFEIEIPEFVLQSEVMYH